MKTFNPILDLALNRVTYSCPRENNGVGKYIPTFFSDCPWLLLIVMAKDVIIGLYVHLERKLRI